jgi:dienelactone hydrolase
MKNLIFALLVLLCAMKTQAAVHTETVEYKQGDTTLEGFLAYDDSISGKRPGVLVVHQWLGLTDYEKRRATQLAQLGYVAFCADIYGKDSVRKDVQRSRRAGGKI